MNDDIISPVLQAIKARLLTVVPAGNQPRLQDASVFIDPPEIISGGDFPLAIVMQTPGAAQELRAEADGEYLYSYTLTILLFLGLRGSGIDQAYGLTRYWPIPVLRQLAADVQLGGASSSLGVKAAGDSRFFSDARPGFLTWGGGNYVGWKFELPVQQTLQDIVYSAG